MLLSEAEVAYMAGFMDGEGTFTVLHLTHRGQPTYPAIACAASTDPVVLDWIKGKFGGYINITNDCSGRNREVASQWRMQEKEDLIQLLPLLIPHLKIKKLHAQLLLKYCLEFRNSHRGKRVSAEDRELQSSYSVIFSTLNCRGYGSLAQRQKMAAFLRSPEFSMPEVAEVLQ